MDSWEDFLYTQQKAKTAEWASRRRQSVLEDVDYAYLLCQSFANIKQTAKPVKTNSRKRVSIYKEFVILKLNPW